MKKPHKEILEDRILAEANYIIENCATVREAAQHFGIGKSTVHRDMTKKLKAISLSLYNDVRFVLDCNLEERAQRGGLAKCKQN